jgi:hypothetical protein
MWHLLVSWSDKKATFILLFKLNNKKLIKIHKCDLIFIQYHVCSQIKRDEFKYEPLLILMIILFKDLVENSLIWIFRGINYFDPNIVFFTQISHIFGPQWLNIKQMLSFKPKTWPIFAFNQPKTWTQILKLQKMF